MQFLSGLLYCLLQLVCIAYGLIVLSDCNISSGHTGCHCGPAPLPHRLCGCNTEAFRVTYSSFHSFQYIFSLAGAVLCVDWTWVKAAFSYFPCAQGVILTRIRFPGLVTVKQRKQLLAQSFFELEPRGQVLAYPSIAWNADSQKQLSCLLKWTESDLWY